MKKKFLSPIILLGVLVLGATTFSSCTKKTTADPIVKQDDEEAESTKDANDGREESDAVLDESNQAINDNKASLGGRIDGPITNNIGATNIAISGDSMLTITYTNKLSTDGKRTKNGDVVIKRVGTKKFHEAGGEYSVEFKNLTITRTIDQKKVAINGIHTVKNTTGGFAFAALLIDSFPAVTHQIRGTVKFTFNNGTERTWTVARQRSFDYLKVTVGQVDLTTAIETGTNRRGTAFTTMVPTPVVAQYSAVAKYTKVIAGKIEHTVEGGLVDTKVTAEYGYTSLGVKSAGFDDTKGYQLTWQKGLTYGPFFIQVYP